MNNLAPINLREKQAKPKNSPRLTKTWIWMLSALVVVAMGAWLTFLGWGLIEALRAIRGLFTAFFYGSRQIQTPGGHPYRCGHLSLFRGSTVQPLINAVP
jgi:hypothetical protein